MASQMVDQKLSDQLESKDQVKNSNDSNKLPMVLDSITDMSSSTFYKEIILTDEFKNRELVNSRLVRLFSSNSNHQPVRGVVNKTGKSNEKLPVTSTLKRRSKSHLPFESREEVVMFPNGFYGRTDGCPVRLSREDYAHIANRYKSLCKAYKQQLADSQRTINEMHLIIQNLEAQKSQVVANSEANKNSKMSNSKINTFIDRYKAYCDKINQYSRASECSDSGCVTTNEKGEDACDSSCEESEKRTRKNAETVLKTLQGISRERKEIKNFMKSLEHLIQHLNPSSQLLKHLKSNSPINFNLVNQAIGETIQVLSSHSLENFKCKCRRAFEYEDTVMPSKQAANNTNSNRLKSIKRSQSLAVDKQPLCNKRSISANHINNLHRPSDTFLVDFLFQFLNLFDIECFQNAPTRLNQLYYKHGKLVNFKKAIQNIIDPSKENLNANFSNEKLVFCVQTLHDRLNTNLTENLKKLFKTANLENVINELKMYDEYFPRLLDLIEHIMEALDVTRIEKIIPSIRALQILAEPAFY